MTDRNARTVPPAGPAPKPSALPAALARTGFGKRPPPLPVAKPPPAEQTRVDIGMLAPSPDSAPMPAPRRSYSPPPAELAPDPQSARQARQRAREAVVEADRREKSTLDSLAEIPGIRRGLSAVWRWVLPLLLGAVTTVGGWVYGYAKGLADAYERVAAIEARQKLAAEKAAKLGTTVEELVNSHAAEIASLKGALGTESRKREALVGEVEEIKKAVPKIQGLPSP